MCKMWNPWMKMRLWDLHLSIVLWLACSSLIGVCGIVNDPNPSQDSSEYFPPARRHPQGMDIDSNNLTLITSASTNILQFPIRNFTKVATIRFNNTNRIASSNNKSVGKRPGFILALRGKSNINNNNKNNTSAENILSSMEEASTDLISNSLEEINQTMNETMQTIRILDRLRNLTNLKLKRGSSGMRFGFKSYDKDKGLFDNEVISSEKNSSSQFKFKPGKPINAPVEETASTVVATSSPTESPEKSNSTQETTMMSKVGGHLNQGNPLITSSSSPIPQPLPPKHPTSTIRSTTPIVLKVGKFAKNSKYQNVTVSPVTSGGNSTHDDSINTGETRVAITADQLSGNRPTKTPFHFTSAAPTEPPTTTSRETAQINRYQRPYSPHNHVYAPTQDPVSIAHNDEDLSVEDFQDIRVANLVFGSKVGQEVSTFAPNSKQTNTNLRRPPIRIDDEDDDDDDDSREHGPPDLPVRTLQQNTRGRPQVNIAPPPEPQTTRPPQLLEKRKPNKFTSKKSLPKPKASPLPQSASSGVENAHVRLQNNNNDNLPFYKEPGGVFKEHKYTRGDQDDESNQISHNSYVERAPGVKYAPPKGPSAQPQTIYTNNHNPYGNNNHNHNLQQPPQQYIQHQHPLVATQQPVYLQPVQQNYAAPAPPYHQHQAHHHQLPQQRPTLAQAPFYHPQQQPIAPTPYYPIAPPQQPIYNPGQNAGFIPIQQQQQQPRPQPQGYPIAQPQPISAPPIQPVYNSRNHPVNNNNNHFNNYASPPAQVNRNSRFPSRSDPDSDSFYGDPRPDTSSSIKSEPPVHIPQPPPPRKPSHVNNRKQQPKKSSRRKEPEVEEEEEEEEAEDEPEEEEERNPRPKPRPSPPPSQRRKPSRDRDDDEGDRGGNRRKNEDYDDYDDDRGDRDRGKGGGNDKDRNRNNGGRPQYNEEYDYVEPNNNHHRPIYDEVPAGPNSEFVDLGNNFGSPPGRRQPFRPSPVDHGPIRPSSPDHSPNFDHPNIQYPHRGENNLRPISHNSHQRGNEFDPRGFGVGIGPSPGNVLLDPIYTRTIKQYDEEQTKPTPNSNNRRPPTPVREEEDEEPVREERRREEPRPRPQKEEEEEPPEEEEEEERPEREEEKEKEEEERPQREEEEEERPPPEEEEEEEEEEPQKKPPPKKEEEEEEEPEEEEEEEEDAPKKPLGNRQRKGKEEKKPPPKKPPPNEKSGDLEEDIQGIEKEFGGIFGDFQNDDFDRIAQILN